MHDLKHYMHDGANAQARAVLCLIQDFTIEESWEDTWKKYSAEPKVARWENCREQGYVVMLRARNGKNLNIAFFEHRNSDCIHALKWEQSNFPNSPTINTAEFGDVYKDKWDTSFQVNPGEIQKMADWIENEMRSFWLMNQKKENNVPRL